MSFRPIRRVACTLGALVFAASCVATPPTGRFADRAYDTERIDDLDYGQAVDWHGNLVDLQMDMFRPVGATGPLPAVVFIHSGAFTGGFRSEQDQMAQEFAQRGYVTVTISYRIRPGEWIWFNTPDLAKAAAKDARHDAQAAVRWLRAHAAEYSIDTGHIGAVGYSAGGITAIGMGEYPEDPGDSGTPDESSKICVAVSISGMAVEGPMEADDAPVLMFHGSDDIIVPTAYAEDTGWRAASVKRLAGFVEYKGIGHTTFFQRYDEMMPTIVRTLRDYLVEQPPCV
jgi:acetyl esterase/lipase